MQEQVNLSHPATPGHSSDDIIANVLRSLSLVDSPPEPGFNRFTRLMCLIADVRMATVTFVDEATNRQFFKASLGLPDGVTQRPLDRSFCKIVARAEKLLAVSDARSDTRVRDNPAIEEMGILAYLVAPVLGPAGEDKPAIEQNGRILE